MVYIDINKNTQVVYLPAHGYEPTVETVHLAARNTVDGTAVGFSIAACTLYTYLLRLIVGLPAEGLHTGEWEYTLWDENYTEPLGKGIMVVTANSAAVNAYKRDITYKQYDAE